MHSKIIKYPDLISSSVITNTEIQSMDIMNIFVLDDNYNDRITWFQTEYKEHNLFYAPNAPMALHILDKQKFDLIFLDHDLDNSWYLQSDHYLFNTGYQVAKGLLATINATTNVIIHSWNPIGADRMLDVLQQRKHGKVHYFPFGHFKSDIWKIF